MNAEADPSRARRVPRGDRAMVLPLVLLMIVLLSMLGLSFSFSMHADLAGARNASEALQLRLAAESGLQYAIHMLRLGRADMTLWYDNPDDLRDHLVWDSVSGAGGAAAFGSVKELEPGEKVYRFTLVADDPNDDETQFRAGITDEASKFNIQLWDGRDVKRYRKQVTTLFNQVIPTGLDKDVDVAELVDALIDWQDKDSDTLEFGAETDYYEQLDPPYFPRNAPLSTVEELLLVRGFTGEVLYGDDYNRNGLLEPNEDDGQDTFPPDNGDGNLDRGLLAYITVYSTDLNTSNDNRARVYLGDQRVREKLQDDFSEDEIAMILGAFSSRQAEMRRRPDRGRGRSRNRGGRDTGSSLAGALRGGDAQDVPDGTDGIGLDTGTGTDAEAATSQPAETPPQMLTPADLFVLDDPEDPQSSNLPPELLDTMMDRISVQLTVATPGLIDVNTASYEVLRTLPELTADDVAEIVGRRDSIEPEAKLTTAWLWTRGVLPLDRYQKVAPYVTARGQQFTIESVGHADHTGMIHRVQAVVEMKGNLSQILYYRDLTGLGMAYPLRADEGDRGFAGRAK